MAVEAHVPQIAEVIQLAIAPVFMLTALAGIVNALNLRLGRAVDRRRHLEAMLPGIPAAEDLSARAELGVIARRIHFVYLSILSAVISGLFICMVIAAAFGGAFVATDLSRTIAAMFVAGVVALIACLLLFLREIFLAVSTPRHVPTAARGVQAM